MTVQDWVMWQHKWKLGWI